MELSYYDTKKLLAVQSAIEAMIEECKGNPDLQEIATDLTYMKGEIRIALSDKEIDEKALPFEKEPKNWHLNSKA